MARARLAPSRGLALLLLGVASLTPALATARADGILARCWTAEDLRNGSGGGAPAVSRDEPSLPSVADLPPGLRGVIRSVRPAGDEKVVALTFDLCESDGPPSGYDAPLVAYLRDNDVRATFFAGGKCLRSHPEPAQQLMADPRFEIGSHSWSHKDFRKLAPAQRGAQIRDAPTESARLRAALAGRECTAAAGLDALDTVPVQPALFRFPYGHCDAASLATVTGAGLPAIQWSIVTGDPAKGQSAEAIARVILERVKPGAIVVAHANGRGWHTAEALRKVVPELRRRGYRFVTVSELLASGEPVIADRCDQ
jgi:peptidoglycan/xylan/chitin deacetylase (PgdA/CDA1 family)